MSWIVWLLHCNILMIWKIWKWYLSFSPSVSLVQAEKEKWGSLTEIFINLADQQTSRAVAITYDMACWTPATTRPRVSAESQRNCTDCMQLVHLAYVQTAQLLISCQPHMQCPDPWENWWTPQWWQLWITTTPASKTDQTMMGHIKPFPDTQLSLKLLR